MEQTHDAAQVNTTQAPATAPAAGAPETPPQGENGQGAVPAPDQPAGQTSEQEAADKAAHEAAVRDAEKLADRGIAAYVAGQRAELRQTMEACSCWHSYLVARMALVPEKGARAQRADAIRRLELELAIKCQREVRVNDLLRAWAAWTLLASEPGLVGDAKKPGPAYHVPLCTLRDLWSLLVDRVDRDTAKERWVLLPGMEGKCRELFQSAVENELARGAAEPMVRELVAEHARQQEAVKRAEAEKARREQEAAEKAREAVLAQTEQAQLVLARTLEATEKAQQEEERKQAQEQAEKAKQELLARQQELARANAAAEAKRKAQEQAERQRQEQAERARKAQQRADKDGERGNGRQRGGDGECRAPRSLIRREDGKEDPVQTAGILMDLIAGCKDPTAVVLNLVLKLEASREVKLSEGMHKVLHVARLALDADPKQVDKATLALMPRREPAGAAA
jgi:hypothetical protein